tara:strand:- start:430 stop:723 length:294 start_codon:yes stop_codon:yes gene_type:complete
MSTDDNVIFSNLLKKLTYGLTKVKFEKTDGTITERLITLDPLLIPKDEPVEFEDQLVESYDTFVERDYIRVYSHTDWGWRTIKPSKLIGFTTAGSAT